MKKAEAYVNANKVENELIGLEMYGAWLQISLYARQKILDAARALQKIEATKGNKSNKEKETKLILLTAVVDRFGEVYMESQISDWESPEALYIGLYGPKPAVSQTTNNFLTDEKFKNKLHVCDPSAYSKYFDDGRAAFNTRSKKMSKTGPKSTELSTKEAHASEALQPKNTRKRTRNNIDESPEQSGVAGRLKQRKLNESANALKMKAGSGDHKRTRTDSDEGPQAKKIKK